MNVFFLCGKCSRYFWYPAKLYCMPNFMFWTSLFFQIFTRASRGEYADVSWLRIWPGSVQIRVWTFFTKTFVHTSFFYSPLEIKCSVRVKKQKKNKTYLTSTRLRQPLPDSNSLYQSHVASTSHTTSARVMQSLSDSRNLYQTYSTSTWLMQPL